MSKDEINSLIQMLRSNDEGDNNLAFGIMQENIKIFKPEELLMLFLSNSYRCYSQLADTNNEIREYFYNKIFKVHTAYVGGGWKEFILYIPHTYDELIDVIKNNNNLGFKNNMNIKTTFKDFCQNFSLNFNL